MKKFTQLTIALLAISTIMAAACPDKKFLNMLKKKDATAVLTDVDTTSTFDICSEVWKTEGSCCAQAKVKSIFNETMVKNVKGGFDKFIGSLQNVGKSLDKIMKTISNKDDATTKFTAAYTANATQFNGMTVEQAVEALGASKTFKEDSEKFKTDGKTCFDATVQAAGKVFCYLCSGTAATGKETDGGATAITQESCSALLTSCIGTWRFMVSTGGLMQAVSILNRAAKSDAPAPRVQDKPGFGGVSMKDIMDGFKNCGTSLTDTACTADHKANLCKANFNTMAPPPRAGDDNMKPENTAGLPPARLLQVTESTGDVAISAAGLDLTKTITTPATDAKVDSSSTTTGVSSAKLLLSGALSLLGLALLN